MRTVSEPPGLSTLRGVAMLLMEARLEETEHSQFHALMQATVSKEHGIDAYKEYLKTAFPGMEAAEQEKRKELMALVAEEGQKTYVVKSALQSSFNVRRRFK